MKKLQRIGFILCCLLQIQTVSAEPQLSPEVLVENSSSYDDAFDDAYGDFVEEGIYVNQDRCCRRETVPCKTSQCCKIPHYYTVKQHRMVPQYYCVNVCRYETEFFPGDPCDCSKGPCYQQVPHYYQEERCRMVPEYYYTTVCKYKRERVEPVCNKQGINDQRCCFLDGILPSWVEGSFDADLGIRRDKVTCLINHYDPPGTFLVSDDLNIDKLNILEAGIKGKALLCNIFLVKGSYYSGTIQRGDYTETVKANDGSKTTIKLKVHGGDTLDCSVGGGLLFPVYCGVRLGPTAGWSYNSQRMRMKGGLPILDDLQYKNRWQGPWFGADTMMAFCNFGIHAGYEYHVPNWNASWLLKGPDIPSAIFSDVRRSTKGYGNVLFVEAYTVKLGCLRLNCQLKYQYWKMKNGNEHPKNGTFAQVGFSPTEVDKVKRATWQSYEAIVGLGIDY